MLATSLPEDFGWPPTASVAAGTGAGAGVG